MKYALLLLLVGCAGPQAGDPCTGSLCIDQISALFCEAGSLNKYACKGPAGCTGNDRKFIVCDQTGAAPGDACPKVSEGGGFCRTAGEPLHLLRCTSGNWVRAAACPNTCQADGGTIVCN